MMSSEKFTEIATKVSGDQPITTEEASALIQTIAEFEHRMAIAEGALNFTLSVAEQVYDDTIKEVLEKLQLRDADKVRQISKIGKHSVERLTSVVQLYVAQSVLHLQQNSAVEDANPDILDNSEPA